MTNTNCCEYSIKTPDDGQQVRPKHVEFFTKIKLRNNASCWLLYEKILVIFRNTHVRTYISRTSDKICCIILKYFREIANTLLKILCPGIDTL